MADNSAGGDVDQEASVGSGEKEVNATGKEVSSASKDVSGGGGEREEADGGDATSTDKSNGAVMESGEERSKIGNEESANDDVTTNDGNTGATNDGNTGSPQSENKSRKDMDVNAESEEQPSVPNATADQNRQEASKDSSQEASTSDGAGTQSDGGDENRPVTDPSASSDEKTVTDPSASSDKKTDRPVTDPSASSDKKIVTDPSTSSDEKTDRPVTDPSTSSVKKEKKRHKSKRKSRQSMDGTPPKLVRRSSKSEGQSRQGQSRTAPGEKHLEVIILSAFQSLDPQGTGVIQPSVFWEVLQSSDLNLRLSNDELSILQGIIQPDRSGQISYAEFASQAIDILSSLYMNQPPREDHWVELRTADDSIVVNFNKQTGDVMDKAESGIDLFAGIIEDLYNRVDTAGKGYVTWDMFVQLLQSAEMTQFLQNQDIQDMQEYFLSLPGGKASYNHFYYLAKELIMRVYRAKDPSESPWCAISSKEVGIVWFNKFTGETRRGIQTGEREQEIAFINQAYAHVEEVNFELEQYKEQNRLLENQLAKVTEDQEALEAQLYETGQALDDANAEIINRDSEVDHLKGIIVKKDQEMELLQDKLGDLDIVKRKLVETEQELQNARETIAMRDDSITQRDSNIAVLRNQADAVTEELKTAHGEMDAQGSTLGKLKHQMNADQKKLKEYEDTVPKLESELSSLKEALETTRQTLEERTVALSQARKHLKNSRERNMEFEKEMEKYEQIQERLRNSESEIRTLKTFLTTKTALIEKYKKDLRENKMRVAELEEKDERRTVILADVLEKTARQYQQQLGKTSAMGGLSPRGKRRQPKPKPPELHEEEPRPYSAPAIPPPEGAQFVEETDFPVPPRIMKTFTTDLNGPILSHSKDTGELRVNKFEGTNTKIKNRSRTVPKLPPIPRNGIKQQRTRSFIFPTKNDLKREDKMKDLMLIEHTPSNPACSCELCKMNASVVRKVSRRPETRLTGMTRKTMGLPGYQGETNVQELALAEQLRIGQRVVVRMKKSEFDLEATKLTGIIKYVGKIDSEYVDHRIYVGVKLDEAVGNTDGLIKSKRYFTCPPNHGKLVRISNVVAVLPNKSVFYKSLQQISKRSPYTTAQKKTSSSISVS